MKNTYTKLSKMYSRLINTGFEIIDGVLILKQISEQYVIYSRKWHSDDKQLYLEITSNQILYGKTKGEFIENSDDFWSLNEQ
jgi:hypothetical protein